MFYVEFAKAMNDNDDSGFGWAYLENELIVWDDKFLPASAEAFCVLDIETTDNILGRDEVAVSKHYYEHAERLKFQAAKREVKYAKQNQEKRDLTAERVPNLTSKDVRESFANKRKMLETAAVEVSKKKQKANDGSVAGPSDSATGGAGMDTST